ncbi:hypothetical protein FGD77_10810 [Roseovarius sp. M141]|nr:hypothetical protein [Roseovarius sp. M141]
MCFKLVTLAAAVLALSACVSPENYESTPVQVATAQGAVTCQLYTQNRLDWDRSIDRPANMSVETADTICRNEGARRQ